MSATSRPAIVITGLGTTSSLGRGVQALQSGLRDGRRGITKVRAFDTAAFSPVDLGGCVPEGRSALQWAVEAAREAWRDAEAEGAGVTPERIAVVVGTGEGERAEGQDGDMSLIALAVAAAIGARGPQWTISTACASSANAIGLGCDLIERGEADLVLAGGAERLALETYAGFRRLGVLGQTPCSPFGENRGTTLGEGAGFVILESAGVRTKRPWAFVNGYGLSSDAWHETSPDPRGGGISRAIRSALGHAGLEPASVGYVNAHGTGTAANDDAEWRGVRQALGPGADAVPISGSKSFLGHGQGAAGVLELAATLVCMRDGAIPPTRGVGRGRPNGPPDPVDAERPRAHEFEHLLANSSAFGGANAVICAGRSASRRPVLDREVRVVGLGVISTNPGEEREERALSNTARVDLQNTDPSTRMALSASMRALDDAGVRVRGELRDRAGVIAAATRISPESVAEYRKSIEEGGYKRVSASAFARLVLNAPAGGVSRLLSLRGPTTTLATDGTGGLLAFVYAADWLARRDDADVLLACGFDERDVKSLALEGAACAVLSASDDTSAPRVAATASAGPGHADRAIDAVLSRGGCSRTDISSWVRYDGSDRRAPSFRGALAFVEAARSVRDGADRVVAVADSPSGSCAVLLTR